jgi:hypothetical protein
MTLAIWLRDKWAATGVVIPKVVFSKGPLEDGGMGSKIDEMGDRC